MVNKKWLFAFLISLCSGIYAQNDTTVKPKYFGFGQSSIYSIEHSGALVVPSKRKKWIKNALKSLEMVQKDSTVKPSQPHIVNIPDYQKIAYRIQNCNYIKFTNGDSVLICLHSVHQDPQVGDVSLAIDSKQISYFNYGHICGGRINFERMSTLPPQNIDDFIRNFVSDTDKEKWKKW